MSGQTTKRTRGFTLIEMMIVVAIIGILSAVAIPSFINYQLSSKRTEAYANLSALAKAQKSYFAEYNAYIDALPEPGSTDGTVPGAEKRDKTAIGVEFSEVGWVPEGDVFYEYDTATPANQVACICTEECFTATAYGDLDGDGQLSLVMYAHADALGQECPSLVLGRFPPNDAAGNPIHDSVARVAGTDEF